LGRADLGLTRVYQNLEHLLLCRDAWAKTVNNPQGDINFVDQAASFLMQCQGSQIKLASDAREFLVQIGQRSKADVGLLGSY
jgi:hypothetical protein